MEALEANIRELKSSTDDLRSSTDDLRSSIVALKSSTVALKSSLVDLESRILALEIDKVAQSLPVEFMEAVYVLEYVIIRKYFNVPKNTHIYQLKSFISSQELASFTKDPDVVVLLEILDASELKYIRDHRDFYFNPAKMPNFKEFNKDLNYLQENFSLLSNGTRKVILLIELRFLLDLENIHIG